MSFWKRARPPARPARPATARSAQIDDYIADRIRADGPGLALAVVKSGAVVHAGGYGLADVLRGRPATPDTIFHLASCGKQFTGLGMLMLADEGKLRLDDPIGKYLPLIAGFGPRVTLKQLLHHTSGIRDLYDEEGIQEVLERCERPTNDDLVRTYADLGCPVAERGIAPGDTFSYSNSGYELLGTVIEHVSRQSYHDFFQRRVFEPLRMKDTFSVPDRRMNDPRVAMGYILDENDDLVEAAGGDLDDLVGSGSFYTTVLDLCVYDRALRTSALVSKASLDEAFTSGATNDGAPTKYGFGWYLGTWEGIDLADHEGAWNGYRSYICYCLSQPLSIFVLSNDPEVDLVEIANVATDVFR